jgi:vacuolar-type H+-ATPase subunit D/Vma8
MADVMKLLKDERDTLKKRLRGLESAITALAGDVSKDVKKTVKRAGKMSAAARKRISAAQKARWAAIKKKAGT